MYRCVYFKDVISSVFLLKRKLTLAVTIETTQLKLFCQSDPHTIEGSFSDRALGDIRYSRTARILRPPVCSLIGSVWLASMKDKCSSEKKNLHINFSLFVECVSPAESSLVFYSWSITSSSSESGQLSVSWGHLPPLRILENTYFGKFTIELFMNSC